jgi:hypothetical protein
MIQEDKQLLLTDLCARLPYNVVVRCTDSDTDYKCFLTTDILHEIQNGYEYYDYKPYLRPLSSITEEEKIIICHMNILSDIFDLFNAHNLDYRGLINKGLAIEAPEGMYRL